MVEVGFKKEPQLDLMHLLGWFCVIMGLLVFLVIFHIMAIESAGGTQTVLNSVFIIFLRIFMGILLFWMIFMIIKLIMWLAWIATTPKWFRMQQKNQNGGMDR